MTSEECYDQPEVSHTIWVDSYRILIQLHIYVSLLKMDVISNLTSSIGSLISNFVTKQFCIGLFFCTIRFHVLSCRVRTGSCAGDPFQQTRNKLNSIETHISLELQEIILIQRTLDGAHIVDGHFFK